MKQKLPFTQAIFWDVDPASLDPVLHSGFIIPRVLMRGTWNEWKELRDFYGNNKILETVIHCRYLDPLTLSFCCAYFGLNRESFRCYILNPSMKRS